MIVPVRHQPDLPLNRLILTEPPGDVDTPEDYRSAAAAAEARE